MEGYLAVDLAVLLQLTLANLGNVALVLPGLDLLLRTADDVRASHGHLDGLHVYLAEVHRSANAVAQHQALRL